MCFLDLQSYIVCTHNIIPNVFVGDSLLLVCPPPILSKYIVVNLGYLEYIVHATLTGATYKRRNTCHVDFNV